MRNAMPGLSLGALSRASGCQVDESNHGLPVTLPFDALEYTILRKDETPPRQLKTFAV